MLNSNSALPKNGSCRPGGGFVFQQVHNILAHVPPENIVAMFDTVNRPS
jgi:uroporphyrinogen decarboxylase